MGPPTGRRATMVLRSWQNVPRLVAVVATALLLVLLLVSFTEPRPASNRAIPPAAIPPSSHPGSGAPPTVTILPGGTVLQIPGGSFRDVVFDLTLVGSLGGSIQSSGTVTVYILDPHGFQQFESLGTASTSAWCSGPTTGAVLQASLPPGTWYLVFADEGSSDGMAVQVTSPVEASFGPAIAGG